MWQPSSAGDLKSQGRGQALSWLNGPCPTRASLASSVLEDMWAINARTEEAGHEQICSMRRRDHIRDPLIKGSFIKKGGCSGLLTDHVCVCVCVVGGYSEMGDMDWPTWSGLAVSASFITPTPEVHVQRSTASFPHL